MGTLYKSEGKKRCNVSHFEKCASGARRYSYRLKGGSTVTVAQATGQQCNSQTMTGDTKQTKLNIGKSPFCLFISICFIYAMKLQSSIYLMPLHMNKRSPIACTVALANAIRSVIQLQTKCIQDNHLDEDLLCSPFLSLFIHLPIRLALPLCLYNDNGKMTTTNYIPTCTSVSARTTPKEGK